MKQAFADSYFFLAIFNPRDAGHARAIAVSEALPGPIVTTQWVLAEVADAWSSVRDRVRLDKLLELIRTDSRLRVIKATSASFDEGIALFTSRPDKSWSLTDCISFTVMDRFGITDALTGDHHFAQAGFVPLLADK